MNLHHPSLKKIASLLLAISSWSQAQSTLDIPTGVTKNSGVDDQLIQELGTFASSTNAFVVNTYITAGDTAVNLHSLGFCHLLGADTYSTESVIVASIYNDQDNSLVSTVGTFDLSTLDLGTHVIEFDASSPILLDANESYRIEYSFENIAPASGFGTLLAQTSILTGDSSLDHTPSDLAGDDLIWGTQYDLSPDGSTSLKTSLALNKGDTPYTKEYTSLPECSTIDYTLAGVPEPSILLCSLFGITGILMRRNRA